ncbi:hypothetical protein Hamer_G018243 [Homarus americanus]|uniref:Uncharacterized protein n=1 Tax=Homarus americanus TaxID=6706 RepID=A0A8J5MKF2_HOMAM|nr:hypothetical protein Hamer_G018243 [Homarus americanus]
MVSPGWFSILVCADWLSSIMVYAEWLSSILVSADWFSYSRVYVDWLVKLSQNTERLCEKYGEKV